ncbi:hypothetical protein GTZ99_13910 [Novosphingobium sp. FSY-8]|uniref:Uncharacterized protein n=1 Tax=Novosphingobium ovatum TaxID=1908523 RepID=A0ABW9XGM3_9SPHN|nr:hypothetical protein [Novosphingobium ovatum]NBC37646.1 hypothetical protein [Novosphingobium ovatum]
MSNLEIKAPGGFVPQMGMSFSDANGLAQSVTAITPLPVAIVSGACAPLADVSVVDAAGVYWLVRDDGAQLSYVNWGTGNTGQPTAPVAPIGKLTGQQMVQTQYTALQGGTGFAAGDLLSHVLMLNIATTPPTVVTNVWANITQGSVLASTPSSASLAEIAPSVTVANFPATQNVAGTVAVAAPTTTALAGTASSSGVYGPYHPVSGRSVILSLAGSWSGSVQVLRSTDAGGTRLPVTIGGGVWGLFTGNCCEGVWDESEAGAELYLSIQLTDGTVTYRMAQ